MSGVDAVVGNGRKLDPSIWKSIAQRSAGQGNRAQVLVEDIMSVDRPSNHLISSFGSRTRAHVQVQNGCDHRCTFCVIPYGRGNSRSVPVSEVLQQVQQLTDRGFPEVVLSGVDLTCWGGDLPGNPQLGDLVERILTDVPNLQRLRLSSVDVVEVDNKLKELLVSEEKLMPHLHLSLQAGHNLILKRMKRRHLREDAIAFCHELRSRRSGIVFGADLIAGFPTETEEMFEGTLNLVEECGLTWLHVFPYSARQMTPAARMPQNDTATVRERAARLRKLAAMQVRTHLESQVGQTGNVLLESPRRGRTEQFAEVDFDCDLAPGSIVAAHFAGVSDGRLVGKLADGRGRLSS